MMRVTVNKHKKYIGVQRTVVDYEMHQVTLDTGDKNRKSLGLTVAGVYIGSLEEPP